MVQITLFEPDFPPPAPKDFIREIDWTRARVHTRRMIMIDGLWEWADSPVLVIKCRVPSLVRFNGGLFTAPMPRPGIDYQGLSFASEPARRALGALPPP